MEGTIAIRTVADFLPVDIHPGFAHGAVKKQFRPLASRNIESPPVPSDTHIRESSGASGLQRSLLLKILGHSHILQVVIDVKRAVYSPVMRNYDTLP